MYCHRETVFYKYLKIWLLVPIEIQNNTLAMNKLKIEVWKPLGCTCKTCTPFIQDLHLLIIKSNYL